MLGVATGSASGADNAAGLGPGTTFRDCQDDCPEMVVIGPGRFLMGSTDAEDEREQTRPFERASTSPRHLVVIEDKFALGKYPVTRSEFSAFVRATGYEVRAKCYGNAAAVGLPVTWRDPGYPQADRHPVVCVGWADVQAYVDWLFKTTRQRYRLPSESEWEYAARAGTTTARHWGDGTAEACRYANVADLVHWGQWRYRDKPERSFDCSDGFVHTSPVGSFQPNQFGLYDMLGNVEQLVADCWHASYSTAPSDGSVWRADPVPPGDCIEVRVRRGGGFGMPPGGLRAAYRFSTPGSIASDSMGFRVARNIRD